jgi:hypothetical protein
MIKKSADSEPPDHSISRYNFDQEISNCGGPIFAGATDGKTAYAIARDLNKDCPRPE